jgi:MFS family permease
MNRGFYTIMAAQFFSSLADNALLIAAIALLFQVDAPAWMTPMLKLFFVVSYVILAAFVGAFADSMPKGRVMMITNGIKALGCATMFMGLHPLISYGIVGFGAAAYSPAKYGILTELLPAEKLVVANGWIEGLTVLSIILGTVMGGALVGPGVSAAMLSFDFPLIKTGIDTAAESALCIVMLTYLFAALITTRIPDTGARYPHQERNPIRLIADFANCFTLLWKDKLGQISLAVTTLFWGVGATLQFIVLKWAEKSLHMPLDKATQLQGIAAVGVAVGATVAARLIPLKKSVSVLPLGALMGLIVMLMTLVHSEWVAYVLLVLIGGLSGFYVVPMNALLQHRGYVLMSAGHSIAVQNFNENLSILTMIALYTLLVWLNLSINTVIIIFGSFIACIMLLIIRWHKANQRKFNSEALIGERKQ